MNENEFHLRQKALDGTNQSSNGGYCNTREKQKRCQAAISTAGQAEKIFLLSAL